MKKSHESCPPSTGKWRKLVLIMKLKLFILLCCLQTVNANVSAQQRLDVSFKDASLETVITYLQAQTGYEFFYLESNLASASRVTVDLKQETLPEILDEVLKGQGLAYEIKDGVVIITVEPAGDEDKKLIVAEGRVVDKTKNPLPGVAVQVKGTTTGVSTNVDGYFKLVVPDSLHSELIFSFIGMKTLTLKYAHRPKNREWVITMVEEVQEIDEVVVTGYQIINRRQLTSAINSVKAEDIMVPGVTTIDKMLEGQIPDLVLTTNSGEIGVVPRLRIRGTSTLIGNREPLWVIDGIVQQDPVNISPEELNDPDYINRIGNAISGLNPQDIERIDVLKDASATALYGTRAANGVIVITTKRGHVGDPIVSYSMTGTLKLRPRYSDRTIDVMTSKERVQFSRDLLDSNFEFAGDVALVGYEYLYQQLYAKQISYDDFVRQVSKMESLNTDWFDVLGNDTFSSQHTVSITGGSEKIRYYASVGYTDDNDVVESNKNDRYTASLNSDINFSDNFSLSLGFNGSRSVQKYYQSELAPIDYAYNTSRTIPWQNADGTLYYYLKPASRGGHYRYNILNELENSGTEQETSSTSFNVNLLYNPLSWLRLNGILSYSYSNTNIDSYWGPETFHASELRYGEFGGEIDAEESLLPAGGELTQSFTRNNAWTVRLQADVNKYLGQDEKHYISASLGFEASSTKYRGTDIVNRGYYADRGMQFTSFDLGDYPAYDAWLVGNKPTETDNLTNLVAAYLSVSYTYRDFLTLNANARYDGSNKFGSQSNDKLLPVWSASLSYDPIGHLGGSEFFDFLQLKFSYGYQGNMLDGQSPEMIVTKLPLDSYFNELIAEVDIYPNPNLKWERTSSLNAGVEMSILKRRLMISSDVYYKKTKDAFMDKKISGVNGRNTYTVNGGEILNRGFNVSLTLSPVNTENFRWFLSTSISKTFNRIESTPSTDEFDVENFLDGTVITEGEPVNTFFSYRFKGLSPVDGAPLFYDYRENPEVLYGKSKEEVYTTVLEASGSREPKLSGGINNTVNFWNFRLNFNLSYSLGAKTRMFKMFDNNDFAPDQNVNRAFLNRWQRSGDEDYTNIPAIMNYNDKLAYEVHWSKYVDLMPPLATSAWEMYNYSNIRVVKANYLKCTNLSLTYMFPQDLISKWKLQRLEFSLSASNLFTISSPELNGQTPTQGGFTDIQMSERPTFSFGLNVSF